MKSISLVRRRLVQPWILRGSILALPLVLWGVAQAKEPAEAALKKLSPQAQEVLQNAKLGPLDKVVHPAGNPSTPAKITLGHLLYFDTRLSADNTVSCATCHHPDTAWAETEPTSLGIGHQKGPRNAPTVLDSAYYDVLFWDGRAKSLEDQALGPIQNPKEMGMTLGKMIDKVDQIAGYKPQFKAAFGDEKITEERVAQAIACFEREVVSSPAPFDEFLGGRTSALTARQVRGLELFLNKAGCTTCHRGPFLTTQKYYPSNLKDADKGRAEVTKDAADNGQFRTPTLRNVALTPPYFHDGSEPSLEGAVYFRANGVKKGSPEAAAKKLRLNDTEVKDVTEFLKSLSGKLPPIQPPKGFPQ